MKLKALFSPNTLICPGHGLVTCVKYIGCGKIVGTIDSWDIVKDE